MPRQRILIVMPNWFGETLFATPFLRLVRTAFPNSFIGVMGVMRCEEVLANNPDLNEFLVYDEAGIHRSLPGKQALIAMLRSRRFDTAFILRRSLTRTLLLFFAGVPHRIGFDNPRSSWLLTHRVKPPIASMHPAEVAPPSAGVRGVAPPRGGVQGARGLPMGLHKAHTYLHLLEPFGLPAPTTVGAQAGIPPREEPYRYYPSGEERRQAEALLHDAGYQDAASLIVLHPGANWFHKRWLPERFAALGDRLAQQPGRAILVTGGPADASLVQQLCARMTTRPIILAGKTTLRQLAACLERASLVVSNDTGVLHIACALGRPVVALYGPTSPAITGPLGDPAKTIVIHHPDCCPKVPCYQPEHPGAPGMASISVEEVHEAAERLLTAVTA